MTKPSDKMLITDDFQWIMDVVQNVDVGLVLLDKNYNIQLWNSFMQNHSSLYAEEVIGKNLFESFDEIDEKWFNRKVESIYLLKNSAFTTWEQRPYLFRFNNYRPITGRAEFMYQNSTFIPIQGLTGEISSICLIIYDVTEQAINKLELEAANEKLEFISRIDGLTQLLNRKTWEDELIREFDRLNRYQGQCSLIIFDIDHFKKVNDNYGHPAGDEVIKRVAEITQKCIRKTDMAGRYGGEEYVILLPHTPVVSAEILADRIRRKIEAETIHYEDNPIKFTASFGLCAYEESLKSATEWIGRADKALYYSKENGRNQLTIFSDAVDKSTDNDA
jgi:diguanylate cyclase (GGDEF)-like protein